MTYGCEGWWCGCDLTGGERGLGYIVEDSLGDTFRTCRSTHL